MFRNWDFKMFNTENKYNGFYLITNLPSTSLNQKNLHPFEKGSFFLLFPHSAKNINKCSLLLKRKGS